MFGVVSHLAILGVLATVGIAPPPIVPEPEPMTVVLYEEPPPPLPPAEAPVAAEKPAAAKPAERKATARKVIPNPPTNVKPLLVAQGPTSEWLGNAQLAGASSVGSGSGGGSCNIAARLQNALRRDSRVQTAVAQAPRPGGSRAMIVWNGDWVRSSGQEGKGLATVRQAMIWEIAFAPEACRNETVRGLVVLSLNETPGAARLAVGSGTWRWSDLLT